MLLRALKFLRRVTKVGEINAQLWKQEKMMKSTKLRKIGINSWESHSVPDWKDTLVFLSAFIPAGLIWYFFA